MFLTHLQKGHSSSIAIKQIRALRLPQKRRGKQRQNARGGARSALLSLFLFLLCMYVCKPQNARRRARSALRDIHVHIYTYTCVYIYIVHSTNLGHNILFRGAVAGVQDSRLWFVIKSVSEVRTLVKRA
jgi:hypothetical protein